ncbi:MAG: SCP2 sterol-binding domain-containing protein [Spongiibacteraceae bacterium]
MIISNTLHTAAIAGLETVINKALLRDPSTLNKLRTLHNHVFALHCTSPALDLYLIPGDGDVRLCGVYTAKADTALSGSAQQFAKLATAADPASALINGELELHGDSQALISLQKILKQLDIDWEAPLAELFGDIIGHQLGQGIRKTASFGLQALKGLKRQFDDYLIEESDLLPPRWQAEKFYNDVDQLAMRSERLQAQLDRLKQRLNS